jgi:PhnB protein
MQVNPYLNFNGTCREAFTFYEQSLGGTIEVMMTHGGTPAAEFTPPEWHSAIMHARMTVGDTVLMASDAPPEHYDTPKGFAVSLQTDDPAEADRIFNALAENGTVTMAIQETFWARRFAMLVDRFAIPWIINCPKEA